MRENCHFDTRKDGVCSFDTGRLKLAYMSPSENFIAHLTLCPLLLVSVVIGVSLAVPNDQNAFWATREEIGVAMAKRQLGLGLSVKVDSFQGVVSKKTKTHERKV